MLTGRDAAHKRIQEIIEKGNHDELIRFNGYYNGFYKNIH